MTPILDACGALPVYTGSSRGRLEWHCPACHHAYLIDGERIEDRGSQVVERDTTYAATYHSGVDVVRAGECTEELCTRGRASGSRR